MRLMYDAVYPQRLVDTQYQIAAGYIGGDTPHVWTRDEWNSTAQRYRLPIWVRSNPGSNSEGAAEARLAYAQLAAIGCPHGVTVALDYETAVDDPYLLGFQTELWALTHSVTMLYGSQDSVLQNTTPNGGFWVANWNNIEDFPANSRAHQYTNGTNYDSSVVSDSVVLWDTKPVPPAPTPVIGDDVFSYLSLPAGTSYVPVELAGTYTKPAGGAKIGPEWLHLAAQETDMISVFSNAGGKWTQVIQQAVNAGGRLYTQIPSDGSVSMYKVVASTPLIAYLVGTQV